MEGREGVCVMAFLGVGVDALKSRPTVISKSRRMLQHYVIGLPSNDDNSGMCHRSGIYRIPGSNVRQKVYNSWIFGHFLPRGAILCKAQCSLAIACRRSVRDVGGL